jgi:hypothetical protein
MGRTSKSILLALALTCASAMACAAQGDDYAKMLQYLTASRIDGNALNGSSGAIALNLAAGDLNQQANLRAVAVGNQAAVQIHAVQYQDANAANVPDLATASIGGHALANASGLISINQASGTANASMNTASVALAQQGIRQASTEQWLADVCACKQQTTSADSGQAPGSRTRVHSAAVEAGAMQGVQGVVQLNQIAGSNNVTANHLLIDVGGVTPR